MTFNDLRKREGRVSGLVALERAVPRRTRAQAKSFLFLILPAVLVLLAAVSIPPNVLYGIMFLGIAAWFIIFMLDCFYYAHYFKGTRFLIPEWGIICNEQIIPYEILEIVSHTHVVDLTGGFLDSRAGKEMFSRLDIPQKDVEMYARSNRPRVSADKVLFPDPVALPSYVATVFKLDSSFADFLATHNVTGDDLTRTANWVSSIYIRQKESFRWWGRDALGRIKAIGKDWARRDTELLEQYGSFVKPETDELIFKRETDDMEQALAAGAHVLLVAAKKEEQHTIVSGLAGRIYDGIVMPEISHKQIFMLHDSIFSDVGIHGGSTQFKNFVTHVFSLAALAEQIVVVISNFPAFVELAQKNGVSVTELLKSHQQESKMSVVGFELSATKSSHLDPEVVSQFHTIFVENEIEAVLVRVLERRVYDVERMTHLFFTYQSLVAIATISKQNFPGHKIEEKALEVFNEMLPRLIQKRAHVVTAELAQSCFDTVFG